MRRIFLGVSIATFAFSLGGSLCVAKTVEHPAAYDAFIAKQAKKHGVPERLVHRILMRESRYDPKVFHNHCYGLMQIKYGTARSMGFAGAPQGLFDPYVNMTYAIPYLANAYRVAEGDEDRAVSLFAGGYYYAAKKKRLLAALRTADSPPLAPEPLSPPQAPEAPRNDMTGLFAFLQSTPPTLPQVEAAPSAAEPAAPASAPAAPPSTVLAYAEQAAPSAPQAQAAAVAAELDQTPAEAKPASAPAAKPASSKSAHAQKARITVALAEKSSMRPVQTARDAKARVTAKAAKDETNADARPAAAPENIPVQNAPAAAN
jgi:hypothetical protein